MLLSLLTFISEMALRGRFRGFIVCQPSFHLRMAQLFGYLKLTVSRAVNDLSAKGRLKLAALSAETSFLYHQPKPK